MPHPAEAPNRQLFAFLWTRVWAQGSGVQTQVSAQSRTWYSSPGSTLVLRQLGLPARAVGTLCSLQREVHALFLIFPYSRGVTNPCLPLLGALRFAGNAQSRHS